MAKTMTRIGAVACMVALALAMLAGCYGSASQTDDPNRQYRTYLSQVNQIMAELDDSLDAFADAVSRNDVVNMGNQLDASLKVIDKLDGLDVPAAMASIHKSYVEATGTLEAALRDYTALYAEIDGAVQGDEADWDDYAERIAAIQKEYDEGVKALKEADEAAAKAGTF